MHTSWLTEPYFPLGVLTVLCPLLLSLVVHVQYVVGVCVFALPYASLALRQGVLPYHVGLGLFAYVTAVLTAASGVVEKLAFKGHCQATPGISYSDIAEVRHSCSCEREVAPVSSERHYRHALRQPDRRCSTQGLRHE